MTKKGPTDLVGYGEVARETRKITREFRQLAKTLFGPAVGEMGELLRDQVRFWRFGKQIKLLKKAQALLNAEGLQPNPDRGPRVVDILDAAPLAATLDDDDELSSKWAGLLASASVGDEVHPSYPTLLSQLSGDEARILNCLYRSRTSLRLADFVSETTSKEHSVLQLGMEHLVALSLCRSEANDPVVDLARSIRSLNARTGRRPNVDEVLRELARAIKSGDSYHKVQKIGLTRLGKDFVRACEGPKRSDWNGRKKQL